MSPDFPRHMSGVAAKGRADGNIELFVVERGRTLCGCEFAASAAGGVVLTILGAAIASLAASKKPASDSAPKELPILPIHKISLEQHPTPNHMTLHLQIGEAHIGFDLEPDAIAPLGRALLAASASDERGH